MSLVVFIRYQKKLPQLLENRGANFMLTECKILEFSV